MNISNINMNIEHEHQVGSIEVQGVLVACVCVCVYICLYDPNTKNGNNQSNQNYYRKCRELYVRILKK